MENKAECIEAKSPWRTRSSRQPKTPSIQETSNVQSDPKTPTKELEFSTIVVGPTPRRSARKSVKPVQEYENIVAQKGLKSATKATVSNEDSTNEGKWIPAVIGRVSTKRGKKLIRGKSKDSKKQRRCTEDSEASNAEDCEDVMKIENTIIEEHVENSGVCTKPIVLDDEVEHDQNQMESLNEKQDIEMQPDSFITDKPQSKVESNESEQEIEKDSHGVKVGTISLKSTLFKSSDDKVQSEGDVKDFTEATATEKASLDNVEVEETIDSKSFSKQNNEYNQRQPCSENDEPVDENEEIFKEDISNSSVANISLKNVESAVEKQIDSDADGNNQETCNSLVVCNIKDDYSEKDHEVENSQTNNNLNSKEAEQFQKKIEYVKQTGENLDSLFTNQKIDGKEAQEKEMEQKELLEEKPFAKRVARQEAVDSVETEDNSMESGDVELHEIPITADDSPAIPKTEAHSTLTDESSNTRSSDASEYENADDSDCIMLSLNESLNTEQSETVSGKTTKLSKLYESSNSTDMPSLLVCSDDEEAETGESLDKTSEKQTQEKSGKLDGTFDADQTPEKTTIGENKHTQALRPSISHVPTPFKLKVPIVPDIIIEPEEDLQMEEPPIMVEIPREARIKSSRKRSFSACDDRPKRNVTFYSPANVTVSIYDGDLIDSCRKDNIPKNSSHRKRSLSVTETEKEMITYIKQKKAPADTPECKKKQHQPGSRTKMPNFSAIHQQQFRRMESISDHVARKAERAKVLSNSALKTKPASKEKGMSSKNTVLRDSNKDIKANLPMPKARQRIELSGIEHNSKKAEPTGWLNVGMKIRSKSRNDLSALDDLPSIDKIFKFNSNNSVFTVNNKPKLPKPRVETTVSKLGKIQALESKVAISTTTAIGVAVKDSRPKFNLSTAPESQSFRSTETLDNRRKRLIDMYKSRNQPRGVEKNREILKGVRTNRRFELQMMSRNRPN